MCETEINFNSDASRSIARGELLWYDTDSLPYILLLLTICHFRIPSIVTLYITICHFRPSIGFLSLCGNEGIYIFLTNGSGK